MIFSKKNTTADAVKSLTRMALIAAAYTAVTLILLPISYGTVQLRIAEAFCVLPAVFPEAVPGLFVGCLVSNLISPNPLLLDVIVGSLTTLASAFLARLLRRHPFLVPLPAVILNAVLVALVLTFSLSGAQSDSFGTVYFFNMLSLLISQTIVCCGIGYPLLFVLRKLEKKGIYPFHQS